MLYPSIFNDNLFDDLMDFEFPSFNAFDNIDRKLYGKHAAHVMKTDVREHDDSYDIDIDLPGFKKEDINLSLENGCLNVNVAKGLNKDEKDKKGKMIRQERYTGSMSRSFYVGKEITVEDVKAKFEDGVLTLTLPKKERKEVKENNTIMIEG